MKLQTSGHISTEDLKEVTQHYLSRVFNSMYFIVNNAKIEVNSSCLDQPDRPHSSFVRVSPTADIVTAKIKDRAGQIISVGLPLGTLQNAVLEYYKATEGIQIKSIEPSIDDGIRDRGGNMPETFNGFTIEI